MKTLYHVTLKRNLKSIMKYGLIPKIGPRAKVLNEEKAIFLFPSMDVMEDAVLQWLGDCFDEKTVLVYLEINLPDDYPILNSNVEYEKTSRVVIPPEYIKLLRQE